MSKNKLEITDIIIKPDSFPLSHTYFSTLSDDIKITLPGRFFETKTIRSKRMYKKLRVLSNNYTVIVNTSKGNFTFTISKGLCSDLGTVPLIGKPFIDGDANYMFIPSFLHDILYIWGSELSDIDFELATEFICGLMKYYNAPKISILATNIGLHLGKKYYRMDSNFYKESRKYCSVKLS